jgi:hypothetical protein
LIISFFKSRAVQVHGDADVEAPDVQGGEESVETDHRIGSELFEIGKSEFRRFSGQSQLIASLPFSR